LITNPRILKTVLALMSKNMYKMLKLRIILNYITSVTFLPKLFSTYYLYPLLTPRVKRCVRFVGKYVTDRRPRFRNECGI